MLMVKHMTSGLTSKALQFLDDELNKWIEESEVTIMEIKEFFGQAPSGMSGSAENVIFLSLWYEPKQAEQEVRSFRLHR